jgi:uncharacterized Zn finger protein
MVSEFDLPCTDCEQELVARELARPSADSLTVAECPSCGGRYYPEETLARLSVAEPT